MGITSRCPDGDLRDPARVHFAALRDVPILQPPRDGVREARETHGTEWRLRGLGTLPHPTSSSYGVFSRANMSWPFYEHDSWFYEQPHDWTTSWVNYTGAALMICDDTEVQRVQVIGSRCDFDKPRFRVEDEQGDKIWTHPRHVYPLHP